MMEHAWADSLTNSIFVNVKLGTRGNSAKKVTELMTKIRLHIALKQNLKLWLFLVRRMWIGILVRHLQLESMSQSV